MELIKDIAASIAIGIIVFVTLLVADMLRKGKL